MPPRRIGLIANHGKAGARRTRARDAAEFAPPRLPLLLETHTAELIGEKSAATPA